MAWAGGQGMPALVAEKLGCNGRRGGHGHAGKGEGQAREDMDSGAGGGRRSWKVRAWPRGRGRAMAGGWGRPSCPRTPGQEPLSEPVRVSSARCCPGPGLISSQHVTPRGLKTVCLCAPQRSAHSQYSAFIDRLLPLVS